MPTERATHARVLVGFARRIPLGHACVLRTEATLRGVQSCPLEYQSVVSAHLQSKLMGIRPYRRHQIAIGSVTVRNGYWPWPTCE
ncbi:hypothetical protein RLIN73S_02272 [Rhodanobacter lindaniclasticus]|jgi:hypothetical protein